MVKSGFWVQAGALLLLGASLGVQPSRAAQPHIVEVPAGPAFVKLPGAKEINARSGQSLRTSTLLRTTKPGRMQVMLGNGRQFRMGGDAQLRLGSSDVELLKGSIIGWIKPGTPPNATEHHRPSGTDGHCPTSPACALGLWCARGHSSSATDPSVH